MIRVVLCISFPVLLNGLHGILDDATDIKIVGSCTSVEDAQAIVRLRSPDILLTNRWMGDSHGSVLATIIKGARYRTRVILIAHTMTDVTTAREQDRGVRGIMAMDMLPLQMISCVRSVHAGQMRLPMPQAEMMCSPITIEAHCQTLTPREIAVSQLVAAGMSNHAIGDRIGIREGTVKLHLHHVYQKLGLRNRLALTLHLRTGTRQ
jgi:DNA-binding NarL/FixJ family response regulator